jgi:hypothetical protein
MKIITRCKLAAFIAAIVFNVSVSAYSDDKQEEYCKKPKFTDLNFTPYKEPEKAEVPAGAQLSFRMSIDADPKTLVVSAKKEELATKIESKSSFHQVTFTLPASLTGSIVRINVHVKAILKCDETGGWLVKVADK